MTIKEIAGAYHDTMMKGDLIVKVQLLYLTLVPVFLTVVLYVTLTQTFGN